MNDGRIRNPVQGSTDAARRKAVNGPVGPVALWTAPCPPVDPQRIVRVHGYRDPAKVRPVIVRTAEMVAKQAVELIDVSGAWCRAPIAELSHGTLKLADDVTLACEAFDRLLKDATEVIAFVLTLGTRFDKHVIALIEKFEPLEALFMESAGWLSIEKLTRVLAADIGRQIAGEGLRLGTRIGPGYSYRVDGEGTDKRVMWPLEQQQDLFRLFRSAELPVELMSSGVMKPKMSRSGLIAVMPR